MRFRLPPVSPRAAGRAMLAAACLLAWAPRAIGREDFDWRHELARFAPSEEGGRLVQPLSGGGRVELTLDARLQRLANELLARADAARGAAVMIEIDSGRVLALAGRSRAAPGRELVQLAVDDWAPAASVFKLATAAALLESGVSPDERVCFHGGRRSVESDNLADSPRLDRACKSFAFGLARSQNAIIARLAHDHLDGERLERAARALGFGGAPAIDLDPPAARLVIPGEPLAFARAAAGFAHNTLSPLGGALAAATIARGGETPSVRLVERVIDADGRSLRPETAPARRVMAEPIARTLAAMMVGTTEMGTARNAFHDKRTHRRLLSISVAGKTGSLNGAEPFVAYSWFVGFAPAERPEVAFAVLLGHDEEGRVRAAELARELVSGWLSSPRSTPLLVATGR